MKSLVEAAQAARDLDHERRISMLRPADLPGTGVTDEVLDYAMRARAAGIPWKVIEAETGVTRQRFRWAMRRAEAGR